MNWNALWQWQTLLFLLPLCMAGLLLLLTTLRLGHHGTHHIPRVPIPLPLHSMIPEPMWLLWGLPERCITPQALLLPTILVGFGAMCIRNTLYPLFPSP